MNTDTANLHDSVADSSNADSSVADSSDAEYDYESYLDHEEFQAFVREAARQFVEETSVEELAEIVFGDLDEAIEAFAEEEAASEGE